MRKRTNLAYSEGLLTDMYMDSAWQDVMSVVGMYLSDGVKSAEGVLFLQ